MPIAHVLKQTVLNVSAQQVQPAGAATHDQNLLQNDTNCLMNELVKQVLSLIHISEPTRPY